MTSTARPANILLVLSDQHRGDFSSASESFPVRTPVIDQIAARGTRFTSAITPSPLCAPARAALASGRSFDRCGVKNNLEDYPSQQPTYYAALRDAGYWVGCWDG
jgi:choline-sulfatase